MGSDPPPILQPLVADPRRQAIPTLRGYVYQVARTVLTWLELPVDEIIVVEGAEDFDRITPEEGVVHQVKDLTANVTLRSVDVHKAIENLWIVRRENPTRKVQFRFLTTAQPGTEDGNPFGIPGLLFWNKVRSETDVTVRLTGATAMKAFLETRPFSADLQVFLHDASPQEVFDRLIAPLRFDTALESIEKVEEEICRQLILLGEIFRVPPDDAVKVMDSLLAEVLRTATSSGERVLDRAQLLHVFGRQSMVTIPRADLQRLDQMAEVMRALSAQLLGGGRPVALPARGTVLQAVPPLPRRYLERPHLRAAISEAAAANGVAIIEGSLRSGKTTAAVDFAVQDGRQWYWLDLSVASGLEAVALMRTASAEVTAGGPIGGVIVDGLPQAVAVASALGFVLEELITAVHSGHGAVIVTAAQPMSNATIQGPHMAEATSIAIGPFSPDETRLFLLVRGCDEAVADRWTRVLSLTTGGAPLLVQARVAALEDRGFPEPTVGDMLEAPPEILKARRDIRLTAAESLPSPAYELLARLSLITHPFDRDLAARIAAVTPSVPTPGDQLDRLVGSWIEDLGSERYRLYLIGNFLGTGAHGNTWATEMHAAIGSSMLQKQTLTTIDAANILYHGLVSEDDNVIGIILRAMFSADPEAWASFAEAAPFVSAIWVGNALRPTKLSTGVMAELRLAQIRIDLLDKGRVSDSLWHTFEEEFVAGSGDPAVRVTRFLAVTEVLFRGGRLMPFRRVFPLVQEWADLAAEFITEEILAGASHAFVTNEKGAFDPVATIGFTLLANIDSPASLGGLLDALADTEPDFQRSVLALVNRDRGLAHGFVQKIWLPSISDDRTGSEASIQAMHRAYGVMKNLGLDMLADVFAEAVVRVVLDFDAGAEEALRLADEMLADDTGGPRPDLLAARANVLFDSDSMPAALEILREVLPAREWDGYELTPLADYRRAAIAEVNAGNWLSAAFWLESAQAKLLAEPNLLWKIASGVDAAYAFWRAGDSSRALQPLREAVDLLVTLQINEENRPQFMVLKRIGHTIMVMCGRGGDQGFEAPDIPCASNLNTDVPDEGAPVPPTPVDVILEHAITFEFLSRGGNHIALAHEERVLHSPLPIVRALAGWTAIFRAARAGSTRGIVSLIDAAFRATTEVARSAGLATASDSRDPTEIQYLFTACCIVPGLACVIDETQIAAWRREAAEVGRAEEFAPTLTALDAIFVTGETNVDAGLAGAHGDVLVQALSAIRYAGARQMSPALWLTFHGICASVLSKFPYRAIAGALLEDIVQRRWEMLVEQRFAVSNPRITVPILQEALDAPGHPWRRVYRILQAAEAAASASLPAPTRDALKELAERQA
jgi:hypothetical protein